MKKSIDDIEVRGRRVLVRLDLNVPLDAGLRITDDRRIREALPTVRRLLDGGGRLILMSHLGRPEGAADDRAKFSLTPVSKRLTELLGRPVSMMPDCIAPAVSEAVAAMRDGGLILLENLRFREEETIADKKTRDKPALAERKEAFARQIAELGDAYVNDAFGTCHRDNASMFTVPRLMAGKPRVVGYLVQKELRFLGEAVKDPARPFVVILGGAKVSDKLGVIRALLKRCDTILIGGAMAYTFLAAEGIKVGKSLTEPDLFDTARQLRRDAGGRLRLPADSVAAQEIKTGAPTQVCAGDIPNGWMGLDVGPQTIREYEGVLQSAKTVVWNGPMGVFETPPFDGGTLAIARTLADATRRGATTIIGGGDSAAAVDQAGLAEQMTHISTGGGASLEYLEGKPFAAIGVLDDK